MATIHTEQLILTDPSTTPPTWDKVSWWTSADDVEMNDGTTLTNTISNLNARITDNATDLNAVKQNLAATRDGVDIPFVFKYDDASGKYGYQDDKGNFIPFKSDVSGDQALDVVWINGDHDKFSSYYTDDSSGDPPVSTQDNKIMSFGGTGMLASWNVGSIAGKYSGYYIGFIFKADTDSRYIYSINYKYIKVDTNNVSDVYSVYIPEWDNQPTMPAKGVPTTQVVTVESRRFYMDGIKFRSYDCTNENRCIPMIIYGVKNA